MKIKLKHSSGVRVNVVYIPETHNDIPNPAKESHVYEVLIHQPFENITKLEKFSGFSAINIKDGKWKRFRMDRIVSMVPLNNELEVAA